MTKFVALGGRPGIGWPYEGTWQREVVGSSERLVIGPQGGHVALLEELARTARGPFGILYVLVMSRCGRADGRYQSPVPVDETDLSAFLREFGTYFEGDGRHHLWIQSVSDSTCIVYDHHEVLYAYGDLKRLEQVLSARGLNPGQVAIPVPHEHKFNAQFDVEEDRIMGYWNWKAFPLAPGDDD